MTRINITYRYYDLDVEDDLDVLRQADVEIEEHVTTDHGDARRARILIAAAKQYLPFNLELSEVGDYDEYNRELEAFCHPVYHIGSNEDKY